MRTITAVLVLVIIGFGIWWRSDNYFKTADTIPNPDDSQEFCYAKIEKSSDSEFDDKYLLWLNTLNEKTWGELRILPAEKDALVGEFEGTLKDNIANLIWKVEGEVMTAEEELSISLVSQEARIAKYALILPEVNCADLYEHEAVEKYLWENISTLSPIAPVLGGNWYVVNATIDLEANTGTVIYEDGHIQEKRNFAYVLGQSGNVASLTFE